MEQIKHACHVVGDEAAGTPLAMLTSTRCQGCQALGKLPHNSDGLLA